MQILDLHTANPIVSYRNHLYNCSWTSNLGTELLFTGPRPQDDLPALVSRSGYSVLAASSVRLVSRTAQLLPREDTQNGQQSHAPLFYVEGEEEIVDRIPVGEGAFPSRRKQARFLDTLMLLKRQRDETDDVTVYTKIWRPPKQQRSEWFSHAGEEISQDEESGESEGEHAESHDHEVPVSESAALNQPRGRRRRPIERRGRPVGRPSTRGVARLSTRLAGAGERSSERRESNTLRFDTVTPNSWDEIRDSSTAMEAEAGSPRSSNH